MSFIGSCLQEYKKTTCNINFNNSKIFKGMGGKCGGFRGQKEKNNKAMQFLFEHCMDTDEEYTEYSCNWKLAQQVN